MPLARNGRLPLPRLLNVLVNAPRAGLQSELDAFFEHALEDKTARRAQRRLAAWGTLAPPAPPGSALPRHRPPPGPAPGSGTAPP